MRYVLLYFAIKYDGNWEKIYNALCAKERAKESELKTYKSRNYDNWISLIDKEYPEEFKYVFKPPFVIFLDGNKTLLSQTNKNKYVVLTNFFGKNKFLEKGWQNSIDESIFFIEYENIELIRDLLELKARVIAVNKKCKKDIRKDELYNLLIKNNCLVISYGLGNEDYENWKN